MDSSMGKRLRQARVAKGLTQEDLAQAVGVRSMSISRFERDELSPGRETLLRLKDALGVTADWLLEGDKSEPAPPASEPTPPAAA